MRIKIFILAIAPIALSAGCDQNAEMTQQLLEQSRQLTEYQAELDQRIQSERHSLDQQRAELEAERRQIARQRHRDPLIAAGITQAALLIVASLPILLLILLLRAAASEPEDAVLSELLVQELASDAPTLLPAPVIPPPALTSDPQSKLPPPDQHS